ncbi:FtsX-like permease family protein [Anaerocolumna sp. AGMB13025]|uniref:ABC transporter permease n=1 Tax=Anaerocolumna sp. AGMB13025 TaxID=3039116 RepID=UPI00241BFB00|nr:ABC transporter permease [Anaerocolumna sp. AGMB13025]WFR56983.1 FtsX-like permease family protein [Anaerocolumna sp. AGMB13025]
MLHNNNAGVIRHLAKAGLAHNKIRNRFIGIVIILAAVLLTFSATYGYNVSLEVKNETLYHALYNNVSTASLEKLKSNPDIEAAGINQPAGLVKDDAYSLALLYSDLETMELSNVRIKEGIMPQKSNELAIEKGYLESLNKDAALGDTIELDYRNNASRQMQKKKFLLVGFLGTTAENDTDRTTYNAIVSEDFMKSDKDLSAQNPSVVIRIANSDRYSGEKLKEKIKAVGEACGIAKDDILINNLYINSNNISSDTVTAVIAVSLVILTACSLVIYNIFYISVLGKVKEYGQLRTLGTTSRQIKKIVTYEGRSLSLQYIPIGLILGCLLSFFINPSSWNTGADLLLALCMGFITYGTVMISVRKPSKIAAYVTPVEATVYQFYKTDYRLNKPSAGRLTPFYLGFLYLTRNRKKSFLTFLSLTFSGILFLGTASLLSSLNPVERARQSFPYGGEYSISLNSELLSPSTGYNDLQVNNPLTEKLKSSILSLKGVDGVEIQKYILVQLNDSENSQLSSLSNLRDKDLNHFKGRLVSGTLPEPGSDDTGSLIVNTGNGELEFLGMDFVLGDMVTMLLYDGNNKVSKTFTVTGIIDDKSDGNTFYLPDRAMDTIITQNCNKVFEILSKQGYSVKIAAELKKLISTEDRLTLKTLQQRAALYKSAFHTMAAAIYTFVAFIACFAVVNLVNTIIMSILSRKNEIGILQAVGLDSRQLNTMLGAECLFLTLGSFLASVGLGSLSGYFICKFVKNMAGFSFVQYHFPTGITFLYFLIMLFLQFLLTKSISLSLKKQTVLHRLQVVG